MPITQSVKKALRQNIKRRGVNRKRKTAMKAVIKDFKKLTITNQTEKAKAALPKTYKIIDKMVKVNLIKQGKANRLKSQLTKKLRNQEAPPRKSKIQT